METYKLIHLWTNRMRKKEGLQAKCLKHAMQYRQQLPKAYMRFQELPEFQIYHVLRRQNNNNETMLQIKVYFL